MEKYYYNISDEISKYIYSNISSNIIIPYLNFGIKAGKKKIKNELDLCPSCNEWAKRIWIVNDSKKCDVCNYSQFFINSVHVELKILTEVFIDSMNDIGYNEVIYTLYREKVDEMIKLQENTYKIEIKDGEPISINYKGVKYKIIAEI